jgi:hypothetical protein
MILETLKDFPIVTQLETPIGFPRVQCLHVQVACFNVQNIFLKGTKVFIVNHANVTPKKVPQ